MRMQVKLEIGHKAACRTEPTEEGFTHDWTVFVRGSEGKDISHFVEKVVFHLHESFPKPKRVIKEPPYKLDESGYGSFELKIEVCFKTKDEPRRVNFTYDLFLPLTGYPPVTSVRTEALTFTHPTEDFMKKLVKGGGVPISALNGVSNGLSNGHPPQEETKEPAQKTKTTSESEKNIKAKIPKSASKTSAAVMGMKRSMPSREQTDVDGLVKKKKKSFEGSNSSSSKMKRSQNEVVSPATQPLKDLKVKFKPIPPKEIVEKKELTVDGSHKTKTSHSSKGKESKSHKEHSESKKSDTSEHKIKVKKKVDKVEKAEKKKSVEKKEKNKSKKDKKSIEKVTIRRSSGDSWASAGSSTGLLSNVVAKNKALGKLLSEISDDEDEDVDLPTPFKHEAPASVPVPKNNHEEQSTNKNNSSKNKENSSRVGNENTSESTHVENANEEQSCQASESVEPINASATENGVKDENIRENKLSKKELYDLYENITKCEDNEFLQKVVDVIETTGLYTVAEKTFEFDLCCLEKTTLQQLQKCLGIR